MSSKNTQADRVWVPPLSSLEVETAICHYKQGAKDFLQTALDF